MKSINLNTVFDQHRIHSHIAMLLITLLLVVFLIISGNPSTSFRELTGTAILVFVYMEVFIFLSRKIFKNLGTDTTSNLFIRNILSRFALFYVACFLASMVIFILFRYFEYLILKQDTSHIIQIFFQSEFNAWFRSIISGLSFGAILFLFIQWMDALKKARKLNEENLIFQNETLKSQINPHFLFNSLNTLSSFIHTKPEVAELFINRLSSIYRYILENSSKNEVPLSAELSFILNYFELHKIRDEEKITLTIDIPDPDRYLIIPVSLQILIENAIKHNMATREKPLHISIYIEEGQIIVKNNFQKMALQLESPKIGLKNLAERVKLITGKPLNIEKTNSDFIVKVPLIL